MQNSFEKISSVALEPFTFVGVEMASNQNAWGRSYICHTLNVKNGTYDANDDDIILR